MIHEVIEVHQRGGFEIRNWISNSRRVLQVIPEHLRAKGLEEISLDSRSTMPIERTLGLRWNPNDDIFVFTVCEQQKKVSGCIKRFILSRVMSIFDPIGFLASFTVQAKILLQDVWRAARRWLG